jgi:hypothetical protein
LSSSSSSFDDEETGCDWNVFCGLCLIFSHFPDPLFLSFPCGERMCKSMYYPWELVVVGLVRISFCYLGIVRTRVLILPNAFYWCSLSLMNKQ